MSLNDTIKKYSVQIKYNGSDGSGVIVKLDNEDIDYFYILTAKHTFFDEDAVDEETLEKMDEQLIDKEKIEILDFDDKFICEKDSENILAIIGIDKKYDFLLLKINTYHRLHELRALNVFKDTFKACVICGYPDIKSKDDNKILPISCEYIIKSEKNRSYEVKPIDITLTKFGEDLSAVDEMGGLSGSGVFFGENHDELSLVGIQIKAPSLQMLQCLDLREIIEKINTKLINKQCEPIYITSSDGIKTNEVDTTVKEYHLTIEFISTYGEFEVTILNKNDNRMKDVNDKKTYSKNKIHETAMIIDDYIKKHKPSHISDGRVFLLFVLPISLMSENIASWEIGNDRLGIKYTIMLRGQERFRGINQDLYALLGDWKSDWQNCIDKKGEPLKNIICKKYDSTDNIIHPQEIEECPLIVFGYNIEKEMFEQLYRRGVSRAIWVSKDVKFKKFKNLFKKKNLEITDIEFGKLHNNLYKFKKKEKEIGSPIMFLYDDPNYFPSNNPINPIQIGE